MKKDAIEALRVAHENIVRELLTVPDVHRVIMWDNHCLRATQGSMALYGETVWHGPPATSEAEAARWRQLLAKTQFAEDPVVVLRPREALSKINALYANWL